MNFKLYKHVIFDFDQTLAKLIVDWSFWHKGIIPIVKKYDANFDENAYLNMYSIHHLINKYGENFRIDYVNFEIATEKKYYRGYELIEKSFNLLQELHSQNKNLYLLTSNCREIILPILKELKVADYFSKIITVDDVLNLKPTPEPFKLIANESCDKSEYLMIGDSKSDSEFAQNVGIDYLDVSKF